jgi:hypothetical protein
MSAATDAQQSLLFRAFEADIQRSRSDANNIVECLREEAIQEGPDPNIIGVTMWKNLG